MELKEVLLKRRSVRKFTDEPVSEEMIEELLHPAEEPEARDQYDEKKVHYIK